VLVPLVIWHVLARPAHAHRTDLSRRTLLRAGTLGVAADGVYLAIAAVVRAAGLPGASRRFTGSYEAGSFDPAAMPTTSWIDDVPPEVDPATWHLVVADADGERELSLQELSRHDTRLRATLDCTSGWYAQQDWEGVPVAALVSNTGAARSLHVHSTTGYWIRFPVGDLDRLLLATRAGGAPLSVGHGFPARLVAPGAAASGGSSGSTASSCGRPRGGGSRRSRSPERGRLSYPLCSRSPAAGGDTRERLRARCLRGSASGVASGSGPRG
jgi:Oxidoreductase molybdopterin binding domain